MLNLSSDKRSQIFRNCLIYNLRRDGAIEVEVDFEVEVKVDKNSFLGVEPNTFLRPCQDKSL